jgi:hypothetical protein
MPRRIRTSALNATGSPNQVDGYFDRVIKYIPADVVGAWIAVIGIIKSAAANDAPASRVLWIAFAVGVVATGLWTWRQTSLPGLPPATTQIVVSMVSFSIWVIALGGPFATVDGFESYYGSLLLIGYTVIIGAIVPPR